MATVFEITVVHDESLYVRQAVAAAFAELDRIEDRLSRFVETSDIARINRLGRGQSTVVHLDAFECLRIAREVQRDTAGAFDVAYGSAAPPEAGPRFELDEASHAVRVLSEGVRLDLGGIGKGFALDRMASLLADWEVQRVLLSASTSTVLALDPPPGQPGWPVDVGPDRGSRRLMLARRAVSGSGTAVQGPHILDPRTRRPARGCFRAWSVAPTAALADALSTAFFVSGEPGARAYCRRHPDVAAYLQEAPEAGLRAIEPPLAER